MDVLFEPEMTLRSGELFLNLRRRIEADPDRGIVQAYLFDICLPDGTIVGDCDLRAGRNENTYYGGNIGYEIEADHRGHRYALKACALLLDLARAKGMTYLIITCDPANAASMRTCELAGGRLERIADLPAHHELYRGGGRQVCIYRFEL